MSTRTNVHSRSALIAFLPIIFAGCGEAPRDNPLDPVSPKYQNRGDLLVRAQSFYPPRTPLTGVTLFLSPGNLLLSTNAEGTAIFSDLNPQLYHVVASKTGYLTDSAQIEIQAGQIGQHTFLLDAVPQIVNVTVYSEHISRWFPIIGDLYRLVVTAQVLDADGAQDVSAVKLLSRNHGELGDLTFRSAIGKFELVLEESDLPGRSLFDFVGEALQLEAYDHAPARTLSESFAVTRIIEATPQTVSPSGLTETGVRPRFEWQSSKVPYQYTFRVDISQFEPEQRFATLFESVGGIPPDSSGYLTSRDLPDGVYYWTVSIIDQHGNLSRSREATFEVQK